MDKEYTKALTEDIEKATSVNEKVALIQVFLSELGAASSETQAGLSSIYDTLRLAAESDRGLVQAVNSIHKRLENIENHFSAAQDHINTLMESSIKTNEALKKILDNSLMDEERFQKFSEFVYKKLDK